MIHSPSRLSQKRRKDKVCAIRNQPSAINRRQDIGPIGKGRGQVARNAAIAESGVLGFGLLVDGNVRICVLPEGKQILIRHAALSRAARSVAERRALPYYVIAARLRAVHRIPANPDSCSGRRNETAAGKCAGFRQY